MMDDSEDMSGDIRSYSSPGDLNISPNQGTAGSACQSSISPIMNPEGPTDHPPSSGSRIPEDPGISGLGPLGYKDILSFLSFYLSLSVCLYHLSICLSIYLSIIYLSIIYLSLSSRYILLSPRA